ncbi:hypothetical protein U9M48_027589, partial [Paspalum notatum var. saurae]
VRRYFIGSEPRLFFDIGSIDEGDFYIKFHIRNKVDGIQWILVAVYGAAQPKFKEVFLTELVQSCNKESLPLLIGGGFNIIRNPSEKNKDNCNDKWPFLFKLELKRTTYVRTQIHFPTYERLDRILVSTEWEQKFPLATIIALTCEISDHTPLLWNTGARSHSSNPPLFRFELGWFLRKGFHDLVAKVWKRESKGSSPIQIWQNKIRNLRQFLRGWAKNVSGSNKKEKKEIIRKTDELDKKAESTVLSKQELEQKHHLKERLVSLLREEEIYWYQRSKAARLLQGDRNTKYFHMIANGKHRKTRNFQLDQEKGNDDIPQVSLAEDKILGAKFTEKEIFTKVVANRTNLVAEKVIKPSQTTFMSSRNIMEGVVILHETLHELHKNKLNGVVLKLDFEKVYDKVNWSFPHQALRMKVFSSRWCQWIDSIASKGSVNIKMNADYGRYFQTKKGLMQGDPLSPFLFNLVADMLAILISRAKDNGHRGVVPHLVDCGLSILQYADDTILLLEHDLEEAKNMKLVLNVFEQLSRLKINFHKNELFYMEKQKTLEKIYPCFCFLSLRLLKEFLKNKKLDYYYRSRFFWQCDEHKKKYTLAKWDILCKPKLIGGLGILNLEVQNRCLLSLMHVKDQFLALGSFEVKGGNQVLGGLLMEVYPSLYRIVRKKAVIVASVLKSIPLNVSFRRSLTGDNSVQSMYNNLILDNNTIPVTCNLWKLRIPLKIKIFLWYLRTGVILTKDNLAKRQWQ